jgi:uncharacterized protein (TIGR02284 family)
MTDTDDIRSTLNNVIETLKDGEQGFRDSAEKLRNSEYAAFFRTCASQRASFASELQSEVARLGGRPETSGSASGAMHRGWVGLKTALTSNKDHAILEEAERGEDTAVRSYRDALTKDLPADIHSIIDRQYKQVQEVHNKVRTLRDANASTTAGATGAGTPRTY